MISTLVGIQLIKQRNRWDFASYDPEYEQVLEIIQNSIGEYYKLGDLVELFKYGASIPADYTDNGVLFIRAQNIREYGIDLSDIRYISDNIPNLDRYRLDPGDILITRSGVNVGNAAVISDTLAGSVHGSYSIRLRPVKSKVSSEYLAIVLNTSLMKTQVLASKGRSAQPNINIAELAALQVPIPPLLIQARVAQIMQDIYAEAKRLRAEAETLVTEAKARVERMILGEEEVA